MMWRKEYVSHLQKPKGGAFTLEQAQAKWDALVAAKDAGDKSVKWDLEGPREDRGTVHRLTNTRSLLLVHLKAMFVSCCAVLPKPERVKVVLAKDIELGQQILRRLPRKDEPLQFEVYYAKTTDAVDSIRQEKQLEQSQKIKNPSTADMQKLRTRATTGLDQMSLGLSLGDIADIRDDMARSSKDAETVFTEPALVGKSIKEAFGSESEKEEEDAESKDEE
eukprot:5903399-Amphidinium_carterae.1